VCILSNPYLWHLLPLHIGFWLHVSDWLSFISSYNRSNVCILSHPCISHLLPLYIVLWSRHFMSLTGSPSSLPITCAISPLHLASSTTPHRLLIFSLHISDWLYTIHTISVLLHLLCNVYHFTSSSYWILYMYVLMIWNLKENPCIHLISQSNRMFSCKQHCNIVPTILQFW
jgi:hypothetical protein